jgi:uncharacterized protein (DUF427 family)
LNPTLRTGILREFPKRGITNTTLRGEILADTSAALCVLETSHPPTYYLPPADIDMQFLQAVSATSFCEWKGMASYYDIVGNGEVHPRAAWTYHHPEPGYLELRDHMAFYAHVMEACYVGEQQVVPQPGNFYGGWSTASGYARKIEGQATFHRTWKQQCQW